MVQTIRLSARAASDALPLVCCAVHRAINGILCASGTFNTSRSDNAVMMRAHLTRLCVRHDAVARALLLTLAVTFSEVAQSNPAQLSAQTADVRDFHSVAGPVVYAATQGGGLQKSSDNGATWLKVTALPARYLWKITGSASDPSLLFTATSDGVYRSANGGATWTQVTFEAARVVVVDAASDQNVLIGVPGVGVYRSSDRGLTFVLSNTGLDSSDVRALAAGSTGGTFFVALYSNATGASGGVFRSIDGGITWSSWNGNGAGALPNRYVTSLAVTDLCRLVAENGPPDCWGATAGGFVVGALPGAMVGGLIGFMVPRWKRRYPP